MQQIQMSLRNTSSYLICIPVTLFTSIKLEGVLFGRGYYPLTSSLKLSLFKDVHLYNLYIK